MMTFRPHKIVVDRATNTAAVIQETNYACLISGGDMLYVEGGQFYRGPNSAPLASHEVPDWAQHQVSQLSPEMQIAVGMVTFAPRQETRAKSWSEMDASSIIEQLDALPAHVREALRDKLVAHASEPKKVVPMWDCPQCGKSMQAKARGLHASHCKAATEPEYHEELDDAEKGEGA